MLQLWPNRVTRAALLVACSIAASAACSFAWEDYRPAAGAAGASSSGTGGTAAVGGAGGGGGAECTSSEKQCGGACVAVDDPAYGCEPDGCDPCSFPNAISACQAGQCTFDGCVAGYGDCDGDGASCETSTTTSSQHCGACDQPCPGTSCVNGACSDESCVNGIDDDGDGMADCADSDCVTFACVDIPPSWKGPVFLYDGPTAGKPDCSAVPGLLGYEGFNGVMFDPPICSACSCAAPTVACALAPLLSYSDGACATQIGSTVQPAPAACAAVGGVVLSVKASGPTASGSCAPAGGVETSNPIAWQSTGVACEPADRGGGCSGDAVCVGNAPALFGAKPCMYKNGDVACLAGFGDKHLFHDGADDTRGCTSCVCGAPPGSGDCSATTAVYPVAGCMGADSSVANTDSCTPVAAAASISVTIGTTNNYGSCAVSGGEPTGDVAESGATTTVCCMR